MTNTTLRPDCAKPTSMGPCIAVKGHFGRCRPLHNHHMAVYSLSLVAQLEQAQWALQSKNLPLCSGIDVDEDWAYEFDTAVPMIYGGYIL